MGKLLYGTPPTEVDFDDRVLVHLQIVIGAKLRRGESFFFSWKNDVQVGDGRTSIWMDAAIPLAFKYSGGRVPTRQSGVAGPSDRLRQQRIRAAVHPGAER